MLLTESILFLGACSDQQGDTSSPKPFSKKCWNLLARCKSRDLTGMITTHSFIKLWDLFYNATPDNYGFHQWEFSKRLFSLTESPLTLLTPTIEDLRSVVGLTESFPWTFGNLMDQAVVLACALRSTAEKITVVTADKVYWEQIDALKELLKSDRVEIRKPNDIGKMD